MSTCSMQDHLSTGYYWACAAWEGQLLRLPFSLVFCAKFIILFFLPYVFYLSPYLLLYLCISKQSAQDCRVSSGVKLHSANWLNDCLNYYYYLATIPLKNSCLRRKMCVQKFPKKHPRTERFQINLEEV